MVNRKIKCPSCGRTIVDNPEKHKFRAKYCPHCRFPYKTSGLSWKPSLSFRKLKRRLQAIFRFFPKLTKKKEIFYQCPKCGYVAYSLEGIKLEKIPDKVETDEKGMVKKVLTWRLLPVCPKCRSNLVRRRRKIA